MATVHSFAYTHLDLLGFAQVKAANCQVLKTDITFGYFSMVVSLNMTDYMSDGRWGRVYIRSMNTIPHHPFAHTTCWNLSIEGESPYVIHCRCLAAWQPHGIM
jgi:hypothetical protein